MSRPCWTTPRWPLLPKECLSPNRRFSRSNSSGERASSRAEWACKKYTRKGLTGEGDAVIYDHTSGYYMWNSAAQSVLMARIDNLHNAAPLSALRAALNSYQYSRYLALGWGTPLEAPARGRSGLTLLQAPVRCEETETAFADRFTGGATINFL